MELSDKFDRFINMFDIWVGYRVIVFFVLFFCGIYGFLLHFLLITGKNLMIGSI